MIETFEIFIALAISFFPASLAAPTTDIPYKTTPKEIPEQQIMIDSNYTAQSILVFNFEDGKRVVEYKSDELEPIASLTKIMTGYVALKNLPIDAWIVMSRDAIETSGAIGHFTAGETFLLKDILEAAMMASSNDAAMALAEAVGANLGGKNYNERIALFLARMNDEALSLGMEHTVFINPTGLDLDKNLPSNYSTANDLEKLLKVTRAQTPILWELSRENEKTIYSEHMNAHTFFNLNILASGMPHFIGGKTGSTDAARESIIELFEAPLGKSRGLILIGAEPGGRRFIEAEKIISGLAPL